MLEKYGATILPFGHEPQIVYYMFPKANEFEVFNFFEGDTPRFMEFAEVPTSYNGVLDFAGRYGPLHRRGPDSVDQWYGSIRAMKKAVASWDRAKRTHDYSKIITREFTLGGEQGGIPIEVLLEADPLRGPVNLIMRPRSLFDAIWVQLFLAISGNHNFRACDVCGSWYPIETDGGRADKRYCSNACRMRAYRGRKQVR